MNEFFTLCQDWSVTYFRSLILLVDVPPFSWPAFSISGVAWQLTSHGILSSSWARLIYVILFSFSFFFFSFSFFFFIKLLSWCSYRWRFVSKDKDDGYQLSKWRFAVTYPCHHDHHLVWQEAEFEGEKIVFRKPTVRNKNVMSELYMYLHGKEICKSKYLGSINTVMLYISTLHRPVTTFDLRILRFRKLLSTSIFVCMHICKLGAKIATVTLKS